MTFHRNWKCPFTCASETSFTGFPPVTSAFLEGVEWVSRKLLPSKESISALTLSLYRFCFFKSFFLRATFFHCWICGFARYFCHHSYNFSLLVSRTEWVNSPHIQSCFQPRSLRQFNPTISSFFLSPLFWTTDFHTISMQFGELIAVALFTAGSVLVFPQWA